MTHFKQLNVLFANKQRNIDIYSIYTVLFSAKQIFYVLDLQPTRGYVYSLSGSWKRQPVSHEWDGKERQKTKGRLG